MSPIAWWWWRWGWSTPTWIVIHPWASWWLIVIIVIIVVVVTTLFANRWWTLHWGSAWSTLVRQIIRVYRHRWSNCNQSLALFLGYQSPMSFLWCCSPWVVVLLAVLNSYARVASLVFEVSAGLPVILLVVAVRPGAFLLEEVVPLGVGPSSGALLGLVLTSDLLFCGRPCVVDIDFGLTSI